MAEDVRAHARRAPSGSSGAQAYLRRYLGHTQRDGAHGRTLAAHTPEEDGAPAAPAASSSSWITSVLNLVLPSFAAAKSRQSNKSENEEVSDCDDEEDSEDAGSSSELTQQRLSQAQELDEQTQAAQILDEEWQRIVQLAESALAPLTAAQSPLRRQFREEATVHEIQPELSKLATDELAQHPPAAIDTLVAYQRDRISAMAIAVDHARGERQHAKRVMSEGSHRQRSDETEVILKRAAARKREAKILVERCRDAENELSRLKADVQWRESLPANRLHRRAAAAGRRTAVDASHRPLLVTLGCKPQHAQSVYKDEALAFYLREIVRADVETAAIEPIPTPPVSPAPKAEVQSAESRAEAHERSRARAQEKRLLQALADLEIATGECFEAAREAHAIEAASTASRTKADGQTSLAAYPRARVDEAKAEAEAALKERSEMATATVALATVREEDGGGAAMIKLMLDALVAAEDASRRATSLKYQATRPTN